MRSIRIVVGVIGFVVAVVLLRMFGFGVDGPVLQQDGETGEAVGIPNVSSDDSFVWGMLWVCLDKRGEVEITKVTTTPSCGGVVVDGWSVRQRGEAQMFSVWEGDLSSLGEESPRHTVSALCDVDPPDELLVQVHLEEGFAEGHAEAFVVTSKSQKGRSHTFKGGLKVHLFQGEVPDSDEW